MSKLVQQPNTLYDIDNTKNRTFRCSTKLRYSFMHAPFLFKSNVYIYVKYFCEIPVETTVRTRKSTSQHGPTSAASIFQKQSGGRENWLPDSKKKNKKK